MTTRLPEAFLRVPIAHRALHDLTDRRPENSRAAVRAAIVAGYGIEIDLQLTADGQAVVFHDYDLGRLTSAEGPVRALTAEQAASLQLKHGDGETIPLLREILSLVSGRVPLLIELKEEDGAMGPNIGFLESATADALAGYEGPVAVMSYNPHSVSELVRLAPKLSRGLVTSSYDPAAWNLPKDTCDRLRGIPDFDRTGAQFISHEAEDLRRVRVQELRSKGVPVLCWTIRSRKAEEEARQWADNVTFEGYLAELPS